MSPLHLQVAPGLTLRAEFVYGVWCFSWWWLDTVVDLEPFALGSDEPN